MQAKLDIFNNLEKLSNTFFGGFKQKGGRDNNANAVTGADSPGGKFIDSANTLFKGSVNAIDQFIPSSIIGNYLGPDIADKAWDVVAPNIINNIKESGRFVSHAVKDKKVRKALEEAVEEYGKALKVVYGVAEPVIDDLVTKFWVTINNMGEESARGATTALIDTVGAAVIAIPWLGGPFVLWKASGTWFNAIASGILAPTIAASGDVAGKAIYSAREGVAIGEKYGPALSSTTANLTSALSESMAQAKPSIASGDYGMQLGKTGMRSAQRGGAVTKGKLGCKGVKGARAANKAKPQSSRSRRGGHQSFMFGGSKKSTRKTSRRGGHKSFMFGGSKKNTKKARKTSRRLSKSINRFTKKKC